MDIMPERDLMAVMLPRYQFAEHHEGRMAASPAAILDAIDRLDTHDDAVVRALLMLRELPARLAAAAGVNVPIKGRPRFGMANFTPLRRGPDQAVYGLAGRFWRPSFGLEPIADAEAFLAFQKRGVPKLIMGFRTIPDGAAIRLVTETRVFCPDRTSWLLFTPYWWIIRAASGLVRRRMLAAIKRMAEGEASRLAAPDQPCLL